MNPADVSSGGVVLARLADGGPAAGLLRQPHIRRVRSNLGRQREFVFFGTIPGLRDANDVVTERLPLEREGRAAAPATVHRDARFFGRRARPGFVRTSQPVGSAQAAPAGEAQRRVWTRRRSFRHGRRWHRRPRGL